MNPVCKQVIHLLGVLTVVVLAFNIEYSYAQISWAHVYGGSSYDSAYSIQQTNDGGYIIAGYTESYGAGSSDFWILKLDSSGYVMWQKTFGGNSSDTAYSVQQTDDGHKR